MKTILGLVVLSALGFAGVGCGATKKIVVSVSTNSPLPARIAAAKTRTITVVGSTTRAFPKRGVGHDHHVQGMAGARRRGPTARERGKRGRRCARSGGVNIAYQVVGDWPFDLVFVPGYDTHLELAWKLSTFGPRLAETASFSRMIKFDKGGSGSWTR